MALSAIATLRQKIRALIADFLTTQSETFTYTNSAIFTLAEENIQTIIQVTKNGEDLGSGEYSFDSDTNEITITPDTGNELVNGDVIIVKYTFYKYSDTELDEYIRASLVWISVLGNFERDYELESDDIYPTPNNSTLDLIVLIASILIKPNWNQYNLPNLKVSYPRTIDKEEKIARLINKFTTGLGINDVLEWD